MYHDILDYIEQQDLLNALRAVLKHVREDKMSEELAILAASVFLEINKIDEAKNMIQQGLFLNPHNYELWLILGQCYAKTNINQAYLCYENAAFNCTDTNDLEIINNYIFDASADINFCVVPASIVILSYNTLEYTRECINSIRSTCPNSAYEIVVVDNASTDGSVNYLKEQADIVLQCNSENVGFPKGCNQGIRLSSPVNDIFLLNNDAILVENSLFWLRMGLYEDSQIASTGAVSNSVSNHQQMDWNCHSKEEWMKLAQKNNLQIAASLDRKHYLVGFALLLKRTILEEVGYLDEQFSPGQFEDTDLCFRLIEKGYTNVLCRNSFVFHYGSAGGKHTEKWDELHRRNRKLFENKWQVPIGYYTQDDDLISRLIVHNPNESLRILQVNCGYGARLLELKNHFPNTELYGIEFSTQMHRLIPPDLTLIPVKGNEICFNISKSFFDYIFFFYMDESFSNPDTVMNSIKPYLKCDGRAYNMVFDLNTEPPTCSIIPL